MKTRATWLSFSPYVLLGFCALLALFFAQTRIVDVERHNHWIQVLLQLEQRGSALDRDTFRMASFLLSQYDPVVGSVRSIMRLRDEITAPESGLKGLGDARLDAAIDEYAKMIGEKVTLQERIKSQAAALRGGLLYMPRASEELMRIDTSGHGARLAAMLNQVYRYQLLPARSELDRLTAALDETSPDSLGGEARELYQNLMLHLRTNLDGMIRLSDLRRRYIDMSEVNAFGHLYDAYTRYHGSQSRRAGYFTLLLAVISVLLFLSLGYMLRRLSVAHNEASTAWVKLRDAVESTRESFVLFGPGRDLVLYNQRFAQCYAPLRDSLVAGVQLSALNRLCRQKGLPLIAHDEGFVEASEQIESRPGGRWCKTGEYPTSDGGLACVRVDITEQRRAEESLRKLNRSVQQSPVSVVITDARGRIEYVNPAFEKITGYDADDAVGRRAAMLRFTPDGIADRSELWRTVLSGETWRGQLRSQRRDGSPLWAQSSISPVVNSNGDLTNVLAITEDITEYKLAEDRLRLSELVFERLTDGLVVTDAGFRIKKVNAAFTAITGFTAEEAIGKTPAMLHSGWQDESFYQRMIEAINTHGQWDGEIWNKAKDGRAYPEWLSIFCIRNEQGDISEYVGVFRDISIRKQNEEQIRRQANYDDLTGLPNRFMLFDHLSKALAVGRRRESELALLFIDLDRFKGVNDSFGHLLGDQLLRKVASRLETCVRQSDTVCRFGGDEFIILLETLSHVDEAAHVAEKIRQALKQPFSIDGRELFIGCSIGISVFPDDAHDASSMMRNADMAMYKAKESGRNAYRYFTNDMIDKVVERQQMEHDLRKGIERGELRLHYQPIVDVDTGTISSFEALVRWDHPKQGLVPPIKFIGLAEETDLILPLGLWVLREACRQLSEWRRAGQPHFAMSVNLSSRQVQHGFTPELVAGVLREFGLKGGDLIFEITEGLIMNNDAETLEWFNRVKALGIVLAVDDFGTGYSSLSYLKRFPMDHLKIDRSFVSGVDRDVENSSLVEAIVAMAGSLDLKIVAEGLESAAELGFLQALGCRYFQGYFFSRPLPAADVPAFVAQYRQGEGAPRIEWREAANADQLANPARVRNLS